MGYLDGFLVTIRQPFSSYRRKCNCASYFYYYLYRYRY